MEPSTNDDEAETLSFDVNDLADHIREQASRIIAEVTGWSWKEYGVVVIIGTPTGEIVSSANVQKNLGPRYRGDMALQGNSLAQPRDKRWALGSGGYAMTPFVDHTGKKVGKLTVVRQVESHPTRVGSGYAPAIAGE